MRALPALMIFFCALAAAQQYRWIDDKGRVQYGDTPPPSAKDVQRKRFGESRGAADDAESKREQAAKQFPVTLYTSPNCDAPCRDARQLLDHREIPFDEIAVADEATLAQLKRAAGEAKIPSLLVGSQAQVGYNAGLWNAALDAAGYPAAQSGRAAGSRRPLPAVKLYTNSRCGPLCDEARAYLQSRAVQFTEVQVEDPVAVEELRKLTGQQNVPVLAVGSLVQRGYDAGLYARALDSAGFPEAAK
jgi:arsenate reductase-like glutaredoxin family protein